MSFALLNPRVWFELALAALVAGLIWYAYHWAYTNGANSVQVKFDMYKNQQAQQAQQQEAANRLKEQGFQTSVENISNAYIKEHSAHLAANANAHSMLDSFQASLNSPAPKDPATPGSADGATQGLDAQLLGNCAAALVRLAEAADGLEEQVVGLQAYVEQVVNPTQ